ncbi:MAG: SlyX protein [Proteobacteria bacterium]|nr:MAG: SlyX protein [Pseudomonadota bacterium]
MSNIEELNQKLVDLETRMAFLEDTVDSLNTTVYRQDEQLIKLRQHNVHLKDQLKQVHEAIEAVPQDETPPHY